MIVEIYTRWYELFGKYLHKYNMKDILLEVFEENKNARIELQRVTTKCLDQAHKQ